MNLDGPSESSSSEQKGTQPDPAEGQSTAPSAAQVLRIKHLAEQIVLKFPGADGGQVNINPGLANVEPSLKDLPAPPTGAASESFELVLADDGSLSISNEYLKVDLQIGADGELTMSQCEGRGSDEMLDLVEKSMAYIEAAVRAMSPGA